MPMKAVFLKNQNADADEQIWILIKKNADADDQKG